MQTLILTAVGPDRAGLVADLTRIVREAGASLAESRMVNLRGQFALLARIEVAPEASEALRGQLLEEQGRLGLKLDILEGDGQTVSSVGRVPYRLRTYSMDQPGIVSRVTEVLRRHDVNVEELETRVESAPFAGTPLFILEAVVTLPRGAGLRKLREDLGALGDEMGCDVDIEPAS